MKICVVNTFEKQVIEDSEFITLEHSGLDAFMLATTFCLSGRAKDYAKKYMEDIIKAKELAPYFNNYLCEVELRLGKSREHFTEEERNKCLDEFEQIQKSANRILDTFSI